MLDAAGGGAEEQITDPPVAVRAHGDEITTFLFDPFDDFGRGIAEGEVGFGIDAGRDKFLADFFQIGCVFLDLGAHGIAAVGAGGPTVGNVEQDHAARAEPGEGLDVFDDRPVGGRAVEREENGLVHAAFLLADNHVPRRFQRFGQAIEIHCRDKDRTAPARNQQKPA